MAQQHHFCGNRPFAPAYDFDKQKWQSPFSESCEGSENIPPTFRTLNTGTDCLPYDGSSTYFSEEDAMLKRAGREAGKREEAKDGGIHSRIEHTKTTVSATCAKDHHGTILSPSSGFPG
jgi:hypothetical protein